ncbi:MAG: TOBE domain-containing protein [Hyphomicrobiales bacterium]|nr:TOBE domain-containing protein [Hyphomicrobiales bacterium]
MAISARNVFKGKIVSVDTGPIMAHVKVDIGNGNVLSALISAESVKSLGLSVGSEASAVIKATDVMISTDV